jgi:phospholipase/carboxylesterase
MWIFRRSAPKDWLVVAPRAIRDDADGGYAWHPRGRDEWPTLGMFGEAVAAIVRFIEALPALYNANLERLYLMGFSQGAAAAYAVAINRPGLVKAIAGLVGFIPGDCGGPEGRAALRGLPIFMAVGKEDERIPYERAQSCAELLRQVGADLSYHEYDTGHRLNADGMRDLRAWLSAH